MLITITLEVVALPFRIRGFRPAATALVGYSLAPTKRSKVRKPSFIIGGSSAAGTSFLSSVLVQHPEIFLPRQMRPEPHYFYKSWEYEKGFDYYLEKWFSGANESHIAVGERSSSYLFGGKTVADRISQDLPNLKLIFVLRNPVERTWANYRYTTLEGLESLSFQEALETEKERIEQQAGIWAEIQPHNYTGRGFYGSQLREFLSVFSREQILVLKSEDLRVRLEESLKSVYDFLAVDSDIRHEVLPPDFTSLTVKDPLLQTDLRSYFGDRFDLIVETLREGNSPSGLSQNVEYRQKLELLRFNVSGEKEEMPSESRHYLEELFAADIRKLSEVTGLNFSSWVR